MAYTPTEWKDLDFITAEKLNKLENGVEQASSGGALMATVSGVIDMQNETITLDDCSMTGTEIAAALMTGTPVYIVASMYIGDVLEGYFVLRPDGIQADAEEDQYIVTAYNDTGLFLIYSDGHCAFNPKENNS